MSRPGLYILVFILLVNSCATNDHVSRLFAKFCPAQKGISCPLP